LSAQGRYHDSLAPLRRCLSIDADNLAALDCLSNALINTARYSEALEVLRRANSLNQPGLAARLAFILATCPEDGLRNGAEALEYARQTCPQVESCGPGGLDALAAALAEAGLYEQAAHHARRALELLRTSSRAENRNLSKAIAERLGLYEAGRPYRLPPS
jgi:tetratricopeptide (TPR) repeat protein